MVPQIYVLLILDLFRTSEKDSTVNLTSSYLDLSPLYGSSQEEQSSIRTFKDGMLKSDTFYDARLKMFPPSVSALLVCFNRFHNYAAQQLSMINEGGRFTVPKEELENDYDSAMTKYDNDLFQTARLYISFLFLIIELLADSTLTLFSTIMLGRSLVFRN